MMYRLAAGLLVFVLAACTPKFINYAELRALTEDEDYFRLPVVFIPGIKGTKLKNVSTNRVIWGYSGHVAGFRGFSELALDYERQVENDPAKLGEYYRARKIYPAEALMDYKIGWTWFSFHDYVVYRELSNFLVKEGGFEAEKSFFLLPYDWRLDNRIAAVRLALALPTFRAQNREAMLQAFCARRLNAPCQKTHVTAEMTNDFAIHQRKMAKKYPQFFTARDDESPEIRFHIVAHSMGGLVAQYFMSQLGGSKDVYSLVTLGTPTKGAMDALKALVEGEYPDTLSSNIAGGLLFEKRSTSAISASFPATFQLLPRYRGAIAGVPQADLGLGAGVAELTTKWLETAAQLYGEYEVVPRAHDIERALGRHLADTVVSRHFQLAILSAACFHAALDSDESVAPICRENERISAALHFLQSAYQGREKEVLGLAIPETGQEILRVAATGTAVDRRVVYGGHCTETIARAKFDKMTKEIEFIGSEDNSDKTSPRYYGDGRVPFESAQFRRRNENWATSFFLCTDHVGLVRDNSFKYNLLRTLLGHWN